MNDLENSSKSKEKLDDSTRTDKKPENSDWESEAGLFLDHLKLLLNDSKASER